MGVFTMLLEYAGAIFLIILSYAVPLLFSSIRNNKYHLAAFYIVITAQHFISLFNYFIFTLPGADMDANTFSIIAQNAANSGVAPIFSVGTDIYEYILYITYSIFGANKLTGQSLSVLVSVISLIYILRIARHLNIQDNFAAALLIIIGLTPSFLFYMSLTFREVFQLFGLTGGIYFAYESFSKNSLVSLSISSLFFIFMGVFHHVLLGLSFILIIISLLFYFLRSGLSKEILIKKIAVGIMSTTVIGYIVMINIPAGDGNDYIGLLRESGGIVEMIDRYRNAVEVNLPRSSYGFKVDTSSIAGTGYGLVLSYVNYLYGPSVFSIRDTIDLVPTINSLGRILASMLLIYFWINRVRMPIGLGYLLIVFFTVTTMWSLGTTNYGQAFRHNSITDWILAIVIVIGIRTVFSRK